MKPFVNSLNSNTQLILSVGPNGLRIEVGNMHTALEEHYFTGLPEDIIKAHEILSKVSVADGSWNIDVSMPFSKGGFAGFRAADLPRQDGCHLVFYVWGSTDFKVVLCEHILRRTVFVNDFIDSIYHYFVN